MSVNFVHTLEAQMALGNAAMQDAGASPSPQCCSATSLAIIAGIALFIIAAMGAAGRIPGPTLGWTAVGLSAVCLTGGLSMGNIKKRKLELILAVVVTVAVVTLGTLGGLKVLSARQVGFGIIGTTLGSGVPNTIINYLETRRFKQEISTPDGGPALLRRHPELFRYLDLSERERVGLRQQIMTEEGPRV